jgi:hypothetical protein
MPVTDLFAVVPDMVRWIVRQALVILLLLAVGLGIGWLIWG